MCWCVCKSAVATFDAPCSASDILGPADGSPRGFGGGLMFRTEAACQLLSVFIPGGLVPV